MLNSEILQNPQVELIEDFGGGINTNVNKKKLSNKFSPNIINWYIDKKIGSLVPVKGYTVLGTTSTLSKVNFLFEYKKDNVQNEILASDGSTLLSTKDFITYTTIKTGLNPGNILNAAQVRDKVWFTNGSDPVFTYNGSTVVVLDGRTYSGLKTPNVPIGKYIEYYQGLPWLFNSSFSVSALHYAADSSTDAEAIAPDDYRAWPLTNQLNINNGDGYPGTSLWNHDGLYAGKGNSIFKILGKDVDTYFALKTHSEAGPVSDDSIVFGDNLTYFAGKKGIYEFNGDNSRRITDHMQEDMDLINSNSADIINNVWDINSDFLKGQSFGVDIDDDMLVFNSSISVNIFSNKTGYASHELSLFGYPGVEGTLSTFTAFVPIQDNSSLIYGNYSSNLFSLTIPYTYYTDLPCIATNTLSVEIKNLRTNVSSTTNRIVNANEPFNDVYNNRHIVINYTDSFPIEKNDFDSGNIVYKYSFYPAQNIACTIRISSIGVSGNSNIAVRNSTVGYVSEITTITTITAWDKINGLDNTNSGTIEYFVKTATSVNLMNNKLWNPIRLGSVINSSASNTYIQWATTMTSTNQSINPSIDYITIGHNEGGSFDSRPISAFWDNRLWLVVSTITSGSTNVIYVKSKINSDNKDGFIKLNGFNIKSLLASDDVLYGGAADSGSIFRLDYGTNLNGLPISRLYETPSFVLGSYFYKKDLIKYLIDLETNNSTTLNIKTSIDDGDYENFSLALNSSGSFNKEINKLTKTNGKTFKLRIEHNDLDKEVEIGSLGILYQGSQRF